MRKFKEGKEVLIFQNHNLGKFDDEDLSYANEFIGKKCKIVAYNCKNDIGEDCYYVDIPYCGLNLSVNENDIKLVEKEYYTFLTNGLTEEQIKFLAFLEKRFFEGKEFNSNNKLTTIGKYLVEEGNSNVGATELLEASQYWEFIPKPIMRESSKSPIKLSELLKKYDESSKLGLYLSSHRYYNDKHFEIKNESIEDIRKNMFNICNDENIYLSLCCENEETKEANLYLNYNKIIGSRFVACIINDLF